VTGRLDGLVALVVGGGADGPPRPDDDVAMGNGRAISLRLAAEGATVAVTDLRLELARASVDAMGGGLAIEADAGDADACVAAVRRVERELGRLDVVVCNVGISAFQTIRAQTLDDWHRSVDINVTSNWVTAQAALPGMLERERGAFVFVTSIAALASSGSSLAYEATKSAQLGVMRHLAVRYADRGVRANALALGIIDSTMVRKSFGDSSERHATRAAMAPMAREGRPEEVAAVAAFLASDDASYVTGTTVVVDGGVMAAQSGGTGRG
jgi:NAD(P)-dependent dehydrogenase (short-subunit alcohol dehydrogenase family)